MKKILLVIITVLFSLSAESLFEVKDASDHSVFEITNDGIRIFNYPDTLMIISSAEIRANLDNSQGKALSRSFSITTSASKKSGVIDVLEVTTDNTIMREGDVGNQYTNFSPENIFLGLNAGSSTTPGVPMSYSGTLNLFFGNECGYNNIDGVNNIMIGDSCGFNNTSGGANLFIGNGSGSENTTGSYNLFIGHGSGSNNSAINNTFIGHNAGYTNTEGHSNLFVGTDAGAYNSFGDRNVFIGQSVGIYNTTGNYNTFLGWASGSSDNSSENTYLGYRAGSSHTSGDKNTYIGANTGRVNETGMYNTFLGYAAGENSDYASSSTFIGYYSGNNSTGYGNSFLGWGAGRDVTGDDNVMIGKNSGTLASSGSENVFLGVQTGYNSAGSGNVFVGYQSGYNETGSNKLYIDNSSTSTPLIHGDFDTNILTINGILKVGTLEIADLGSTSLGVDGDIIQYSTTSGYDLGNNVAGEYWDDVVANDFITYVAKDTKNTARSIDSGLSKILQLRPVTFKNDRKRFGLIPDEVENVIPEVVVSQDIDIDPKTGEKIITETEKGMNYIELIPVLIKSIQEQQEEIEKLRTEISEMKKNVK